MFWFWIYLYLVVWICMFFLIDILDLYLDSLILYQKVQKLLILFFEKN
jgi:hypothetical protein